MFTTTINVGTMGLLGFIVQMFCHQLGLDRGKTASFQTSSSMFLPATFGILVLPTSGFPKVQGYHPSVPSFPAVGKRPHRIIHKRRKSVSLQGREGLVHGRPISVT